LTKNKFLFEVFMSSTSAPLRKPQGAAASAGTAPVSRSRTILAGSVGNAVEWFDWTIYASFAIFFSSQFFPEGNETTALLATFGIFAVGFFMRPVGGWLLGIFSDRYGRKAALGLTILMMAGGSLIIAVTPTYASIGLAAPLLLTAARLLQGLSLGGEYASATTFLAEMAPPNKRGFYSSFVFFSAAVGDLDQGRDGRLGLAHSVLPGRAGRSGRHVDPPLDPGDRSVLARQEGWRRKAAAAHAAARPSA
jgi:MHS family alpha-ketoglutarate permease-like MFS transporter